MNFKDMPHDPFKFLSEIFCFRSKTRGAHILEKKSEFIVEETRSCKKSKMVGKRNIQEDEIVAEEVRKYPCLYGKSDSGYKEREIE